MRDPQLLFRTDFCQRHAVLGIVEDRVVAEPTRSTRRVGNLTLDDPRRLECDDSVMHDGDGAHEASRSLDSWCFVETPVDLSELFRVRGVRTDEARGVNPWLAIKRVDDQPGIFCD